MCFISVLKKFIEEVSKRGKTKSINESEAFLATRIVVDLLSLSELYQKLLASRTAKYGIENLKCFANDLFKIGKF